MEWYGYLADIKSYMKSYVIFAGLEPVRDWKHEQSLGNWAQVPGPTTYAHFTQ